MLETWGIDTDPVLAAAGLTRAAVMQPGAHITRDDHLRVVRHALTLPACRGLGLHFGSRVSLRHYGVIGHAMLSSANIRQVVELFIRYHSMTGPLLGISLRSVGPLVVVSRHDVFRLGELREFAVEEFLSSWVTALGAMLDEPFAPAEVRVNYPPPAHSELYATFFRCPVLFDAGVVELRFDAACLDRPLSFADPAMAELCRERCERLLRQLNSQGGLVEDVRRVLMDTPGQPPGLDAVAHRLHLSIRTLRRRLTDQRTTFREIDREIRHTLALEYLQETNLPIKQVADLVGFENPANFTRAFQRWAGCSPRRSRQK
jgi:AraC-like DNA-binding protein